jgi:protein-S-isoprenylcysteine O-methyltransferase Ste14
MTIDPTLYYAHAAFWGVFGATRLVLRSADRGSVQAPQHSPVPKEGKTAPFSRSLLAFHMLAFTAMYWGIGIAVFSGRMPVPWRSQRILGASIIGAAAMLMAWALVCLRSWRFRAKLEESHQLATGGPFKLIRHPIYMGLNLLALGSAIWIPTPLLWIGLVLMILGSDLRARAEENILEQAFGPVYRDYCARTRRFLPGIY